MSWGFGCCINSLLFWGLPHISGCIALMRFCIAFPAVLGHGLLAWINSLTIQGSLSLQRLAFFKAGFITSPSSALDKTFIAGSARGLWSEAVAHKKAVIADFTPAHISTQNLIA